MPSNGAENLIRTALAAGIDVCFANPGTTEMPLVAALDAVEGMRAVLGLFEGVCTGAADGYARMTGRPALTLTHLGPGFANGIANLHNARRARSPVVNLIGDHVTWHLASDAPLTADIESLARPVSAWVRKSTSASSVTSDMAEAIAAASTPPGQIATLIVPADCQWDPADGIVAPISPAASPSVSKEAVRAAADLLRQHRESTALFLGGRALRADGLKAAGRIAAATGCRLVCETFPSRLDRGEGLPSVEKLPYFPEPALELMGKFAGVVIAGAPSPVAFFGYPNLPSSLIPATCGSATLATPTEDAIRALEHLADHLDAPPDAASAAPPVKRPELPSGALNAASIGAVLAALMTDGCILMDEAATTGMPFFAASSAGPAHTYLTLTGGAIGQGLPCATGAAVACPDRKVIAFEADGSGMYTVQSLWTQAREHLDVTTLICNNRRYRILQVELARAGITEPGRKARSLTSLSNPEIDWSKIAAGMGIPSVRVETAEDLARQLQGALKEHGPNLIEMLI
jgi:acetolactate synthase I/II/III large subunit